MQGTLLTIDVNAADRALRRFTSWVLQLDGDLPYPAIRDANAESLQLLVHMKRRRGRRLVTEVFHVRARKTGGATAVTSSRFEA